MGHMKLSDGLRRYLRRQKLIIKHMAKDTTEYNRLTAELLKRFYKKPGSGKADSPAGLKAETSAK